MADVTTVGQLLTKPEERDAIHVAVACVVAGEELYPGTHIGFKEEGDTETVIAIQVGGVDPIGIVDPFLLQPAQKGERFWMFLYPHTITSLKHNWTHPAFGPEVKVTEPKGDVAASEAWLREFVKTADCPDYDTLIAAAIGDHHKNYGEDGYYNSRISNWGNGDYLHFGGRDAHGEIPAEFWDHVEVVTGQKIEKRAKYFSCSC